MSDEKAKKGQEAEKPGEHPPVVSMPLLCSGLSSFDYSYLVEWMNDPKRKPANVAFTAGCARDAARAFEEHLRDKSACNCWKCAGLKEDPYAEDVET